VELQLHPAPFLCIARCSWAVEDWNGRAEVAVRIARILVATDKGSQLVFIGALSPGEIVPKRVATQALIVR
jgi:hypothetical protein